MHHTRAFISLCLTIAAASAVIVPSLSSNPTVSLLSSTSRQAASTIPGNNGGFCEPIAELNDRLKVYKKAMKEKRNEDGTIAISDNGAEDLANYFEAIAKMRKEKIKKQRKEDREAAKQEKKRAKAEQKRKKEEEKAEKKREKEEEKAEKKRKKEEEKDKKDEEKSEKKREKEEEKAEKKREKEEKAENEHEKEEEKAENENLIETAFAIRLEEGSYQDDDDDILCYTPELLELYFKILVPYRDPTPTFPGQGAFSGAHEIISPKQFKAAPEAALARTSLLPGVLRKIYEPCTHYYGCIYVDCYCCLHGWLGSGRRGFEYCADSIDVPFLNSETVRDRECKVAFIKWWVISEPGGLEAERPCFDASRCDAWLWENTMDDLKDPRKCLCDSSPYKGMPGFSGSCVKKATDLVMSFEPKH